MRRITSAHRAELKLLFLVLLMLMSSVLSSNSQAASLPLDERRKVDLGQYGEILEDRQRRWDIDSILASNDLLRSFRPLENGDLMLRSDIKRYWLRFRLRNDTEQTQRRVMELRPANMGDVAAFLYRTKQARSTPLTPFFPPEAMIRSQQLYRITIAPNSSADVFLRIEAHGEQRLWVQLFHDIDFLVESDHVDAYNFFLLGMFCLVGAYCLLASLIYSEPLFACQSLYCLLLSLSQLMAWGYFGEAQGILPPWDGGAMLPSAIGILCCEVIFALYFPIYPKQKPGRWPQLLRALLCIHLLALLAALTVGAQSSSIILGILVPLTAATTLFAGLDGYFVSYSRLLFYYLASKAVTIVMCLLAQLSYLLGALDIYDMNATLALAGLITALTHAALLVARAYKRWRSQQQEAQRIAVVGEVNRAKGEVLARVTHDIRTPISAMLGVTELLQETQLTASQEDYLRSLQRSSHELLQLLEEAGQAARFRESDIELSSQLLSLAELVSDVLSGFRNMAAERDLELISDLSNELPSQLLGDPSRLRQLLIHSMNSAFEHSDSGFILLKIYPASPRPGHLHIEISHRGSPFSNDERQALHPQNTELADTAMSTRFAIIARLVSLMQGQASVRNSGNRDIHSLCLSLQLSVAYEESPPETNIELLGNKRLLVVDTNKTFCEVVSKQCAPWGVSAFAASNEQAALAIIRNQRLLHTDIDFVLIDHRQSDNGLQLARRIRKEFSNEGRPPSVLILAHANISYRREDLQEAGIQRVLSKPLGNIALRTALLGESHYTARGRQIDQYSSDALSYTSLHCLIAEDNASNALVLERMLKSLGITVQHADNGQQALNYFIRGHYDLVILDIEMPVMDGIEAAQRIRQFEVDEERERTPIFGLTANALDEQRDSYLQAGMDLHLVKPIRLWELAESIQRWTGYQHQKN